MADRGRINLATNSPRLPLTPLHCLTAASEMTGAVPVKRKVGDDAGNNIGQPATIPVPTGNNHTTIVDNLLNSLYQNIPDNQPQYRSQLTSATTPRSQPKHSTYAAAAAATRRGTTAHDLTSLHHKKHSHKQHRLPAFALFVSGAPYPVPSWLARLGTQCM